MTSKVMIRLTAKTYIYLYLAESQHDTNSNYAAKTLVERKLKSYRLYDTNS